MSGTALVNGATLAYDLIGRGPAVVLISGGGTLDRRMWNAQVAALAARHTVLCYDVRGIGGSSPPDGPFSHSDDLHALMQSIRIARASLVGLSLGAAVAIDFALDHPEMVQGLVLAAPGLSNERDANVQAALAAAEAARTQGLPSVVDAIVNNDVVLASAGGEVRRLVRTMYLENAHVFASDFALVRLWRPTDPPAAQRLSTIRVPTLVLVGNRDTAHIRETVDVLTARIPHAETKVLKGGGHLLNLDTPEAFNEAMLDFLVRRAGSDGNENGDPQPGVTA